MADAELTLRGLYAARVPEAGAHPSEDDWARLAEGAMDERERSAALDHVVRCTGCAAVYRALVDLEEGARVFDPSLPRHLGVSGLTVGQTARWGAWAAVAAAAAAVFAIAQPRPALAPASSAPPAPSTGLELRSAARRPEPTEPVGAVARWPERLRWSASDAARSYRVRILDAEGEVIWTSPLVAATEIAWPAEVAPRPGRLYWQVLALPEGGREADASASVSAGFDYTP